MNKEQKEELVQLELELNALILRARQIQLKINARNNAEENRTEFIFFLKRAYSETESGHDCTLVARASKISAFKLFTDLIE